LPDEKDLIQKPIKEEIKNAKVSSESEEQIKKYRKLQ
jgi:hypothetical protein